MYITYMQISSLCLHQQYTRLNQDMHRDYPRNSLYTTVTVSSSKLVVSKLHYVSCTFERNVMLSVCIVQDDKEVDRGYICNMYDRLGFGRKRRCLNNLHQNFFTYMYDMLDISH